MGLIRIPELWNFIPCGFGFSKCGTYGKKGHMREGHLRRLSVYIYIYPILMAVCFIQFSSKTLAYAH